MTDFESYDWQGFDGIDYNEYPPERVSKELSALKKKNREAFRLVQNFLQACKVLSADQETELLDLKAKSQVMENASDLQEGLKNLVSGWRNGK